MNTNIYISGKLKKIIPSSLIETQENILLSDFNKWNATFFYVDHKKCLLITNSKTKYSVIISRITVSDFKNLTSIFIKSLYEQLNADDISINVEMIEKQVGTLKFHKTNNDKSVIGIQNYILYYIDDWKHEFGNIDNWNFKDINCRINSIPYKQIDYSYPKEKMKELIDRSV